MALNRKYSALPDLDTAPDIYETPELTDDNSTVLTTTGRSPSEDGSEVDDAENTGISRSHVQVDQARARFLGADVDARDANFSDRVDGKRKSYRTSTRRRLKDGGVELGDLSDEDDDDNLERKIARLKREVEEAKEAYAKQQAEAAVAAAAAGEETSKTKTNPATETDLATLSNALDEIAQATNESTSRKLPVPWPSTLPPSSVAADAKSAAAAAAATGGESSATSSAPSLTQVADFDRRLVLLERSLGIGSSVLPELELTGSGTTAAGTAGTGIGTSNGRLPRAILPTLDTLQRQVGMLAEASTASLDGISRRVRTLRDEADELTKARKAAKAAHEELLQVGAVVGTTTGGATGPGGTANTAKGTSADEDKDSKQAKINALYGTLPTIESLTPLLPPLLDRLRSLRAIHADAAAASELLDGVEQRQSELAGEVALWRKGLDQIATSMQTGEATMDKNVQVMDGWVKELEARLDKLAV